MSDKWIYFQSYMNDLNLIEAINELIINLKLSIVDERHSFDVEKNLDFCKTICEFLGVIKKKQTSSPLGLTGMNPRINSLIDDISKNEQNLALNTDEIITILKSIMDGNITLEKKKTLIEQLSSLRDTISSHQNTETNELFRSF